LATRGKRSLRFSTAACRREKKKDHNLHVDCADVHSTEVSQGPASNVRKAFLGKQANIVFRSVLLVWLSLTLCPIQYFAPTKGVETWAFALNYAAAHHLVMGRDIVWTYGPLSYLLFPFDVGGNLAKGLIFQGALWVLVIVVLWDLFLHGGFALRNLALFSALIILSIPEGFSGFLLSWLALILLAHFRVRGGMVRYVGALTILGLTPLIQFYSTMLAAGIVIAIAVDLLLRDRRGVTLELALALTVPFAVATIGCRLALGSFHALGEYIKSSLELARGYSVAMSQLGPHMELVAALKAILLVLIALYLLARRDHDKARFFGLILSIPILLSFKHSFVRQDLPHVFQFFGFAALALALIALVIPLKQFTKIGLAVVLVLFGAVWQDYILRSFLRGAVTVAAITDIRTPALVWRTLHFSGLRRSLDAEGQAGFPTASRIEPGIKLIVGREPTAFLSDYYSNALVDDINLVLFPVLQPYSAYTPYLDQLNATWIESKGPRFLICGGLAVDARQLWTETPRTWAEVYRWYSTRWVGPNHLLLERRAEPRFSHFQVVAHRMANFGEELLMPVSQGAVFWTTECSLTRSGEWHALFFRVPPVMMDVHENNGRTWTRRATLPLLGAPSPGNYLPTSLVEFAEVLSQSEKPDFSVKSIEFRSLGKSAYQPVCAVEFLRALP
jgi:hypothetical protein